MWTKARCLAVLEDRLPDRFTMTATFTRPLLLPATVILTAAADGEPWRIALFDEDLAKPYLVGSVDTRMHSD